jgi:hypothetical protein
MPQFFYTSIAIFYVFLSVKYFGEIENKILKSIAAVFGIAFLIYLTKLIFPIQTYFRVNFLIAQLITTFLFLFYLIRKGNRTLMIIFIIPFLLKFIFSVMHFPFAGPIDMLKFLSLGIFIYLTLQNFKRKDSEMEPEIKVMNLFAVDLVLGIVGMGNYLIKTFF